MKNIIKHKIAFIFFLIFILSSCTEQYILQSNTFDDAIVIEATITNELKHQHIKISRTYRLEDKETSIESGAQVYITDNLGNQYNFEELDNEYVSSQEFQATKNNNYKLTIITKEGKTYQSSTEKLTTENQIQDIDKKVVTQNGQTGVQLNIKSFDPANSSKYYRYEYEETYKIIAPLWRPYKAIVVPGDVGSSHDEIAIIQLDDTERKTCFSTYKSNDIIQHNTIDLNEDRVDFEIRFISSDNPIIAHRYSILVKQYVQNINAYTFYNILKKLSDSESILSQNQPGFFSGNIKCIDNPKEKVIGFFDVSAVSSKRIFFNYQDIFPNQEVSNYFVDCTARKFKFCFISTDPECKGAILLSNISSNTLLYITEENQLYYYMALPPCIDCTSFSSNIKPSFWID